jgi:hypothetical protein
MMKIKFALLALVAFVALSFYNNRGLLPAAAQSPARARSGSDWADWRGPTRDGHAYEKGLPEKWDPKSGENLLWKAPFGGRSAPIAMNGRVFVFNSAGDGETMQERVMALDAETGDAAGTVRDAHLSAAQRTIDRLAHWRRCRACAVGLSAARISHQQDRRLAPQPE